LRSVRIVAHREIFAYHEALNAAGITNESHLMEGADRCYFGGDIAPIIDTTVTFLRTHLAAVGKKRNGQSTSR
jgi:hypothetical protein